MRKWRVGSISMGLSLMLIGILLFLSQVKEFSMVEPLLVWWPLILVVLGIEILVNLFLSKEEQPVVKYDFLSILFVGVIGTIGIAFALLISTGLMTEVKNLVGAEHASMNLPEVEEELDSSIKRIVLETNHQSVDIEGTEANEFHIFGTYSTNLHPESKPPIAKREDYTLIKTIGDTLYVTLKEPSNQSGPFSTYTSIEPTIIVPNHIQFEVRGEHNSIDLYTGSLQNDWNVSDVSHITVHISKKSDLLLSAISNNNLEDGNVKWDKIENQEESHNSLYKGTLKVGEGKHQLQIFNSDYVSVNLAEEM